MNLRRPTRPPMTGPALMPISATSRTPRSALKRLTMRTTSRAKSTMRAVWSGRSTDNPETAR